jgi:beta-1,4-mannosyl-glycoprotein beta-1,4-N-acetylglucosaminyltransferase
MTRVYDCFLFDSELDLLEHRLSELAQVVDCFVIVEAATTFSGQPKPLVLKENLYRFRWCRKKIRRVEVAPLLGDGPEAAWEREAQQRAGILAGLRDARPDDLVMISDLDEIPGCEVVARLRDTLREPAALEMIQHYLYAGQVAPGPTCCAGAAGRKHDVGHDLAHGGSGRWRGATALRAHDLVEPGADSVMRLRHPREWRQLRRQVVTGAGHHLTSVDPTTRPLLKIPRYSHAEYATPRTLSPRHLARCDQYGVHFLGWWRTRRCGPAEWDGGLARIATRYPDWIRFRIRSPEWYRETVQWWAARRQDPSLPGWVVEGIDLLFPVLAWSGIRRLFATRERTRSS